jgi:uncharacterized protein DUF6920
MRLRILLTIGLSLVGAFAVVATYGSYDWAAGTRKLRARLEAARVPRGTQGVDFRELEGLPACVQRYFSNALKPGRALVAAVTVRHSGTFNLSEAAEQWKPFTSDQLVITQRPGFDWDARIRMFPGLSVRVHDAYVSGEGMLRAALFGLFSVADVRGTGELADGELMRFLAEAAWYPTALLPSQGVRWEDAGASSARCTLADGGNQVSLLFTFSDQGLIDSVRAEARGRMVAGKTVPTPWQGRFWNYVEQSGMLVPLDGEVAWLLPEGAKPYWRGHILESRYDFAR